jgi:F-type H+-transporting ATPase subunit alpha
MAASVVKKVSSSETTTESLLEEADRLLERIIADVDFALGVDETGTVLNVGKGIVGVSGLPHVRSQELVRFPGNVLGMALNLEPDQVGVVLLDESEELAAGQNVRRTERVADIPVGEGLLGRVIDAVGRPRDRRGSFEIEQRLPVERPAPAIMDRAPVETPLQTGLKVVDALIPIGRGQRELILGDRQTGKTAIAVDTVINQRDTGVVCIYCAIGKQSSATARVIADLREHDALDHCVFVVAGDDDPPGQRFVAPYAAMSIGEYFRDKGGDALVVFDDLTRHARAYREISLLLRRPPGREAYPGDIFYIHARLLERATHLRDEHGGGSLTALPIIETQAQNISAYIPTNLVSITDGQVYLSPQLFHKGIMPAVDVGKSVSRVGGKTQLPAYRAVAGDLRLAYSQFNELEAFSRFGTRLDEETQQTLRRGRRVREILKQPQSRPISVTEQIAALLATTEGLFDGVPLDRVGRAERAIRKAIREESGDVRSRITAGEKMSEEDRKQLVELVREQLSEFMKEPDDGDTGKPATQG